MYHQISPTPPADYHKYTVAPAAFSRQMAWLAAARYTPITLDQAFVHSRGSVLLPKRAVVITFDDGFAECAEHAVPILRRRHFKATFYLVAGLMGETSRWDLAEGHSEMPLLEQAAARVLVEAGFTCGSHSVTHPHLAELAPNDCRDELRMSRRLLEERLGCTVLHLAYPFGSFNQRVCALAAEAGYETACSVRIGISGLADDRYALHRVPICGADSLVDFVCLVHRGQRAIDCVRSAARRALRLGRH